MRRLRLLALFGQTAASRGIPIHGLVDGVEVSLSTITAFAEALSP